MGLFNWFRAKTALEDINNNTLVVSEKAGSTSPNLSTSNKRLGVNLALKFVNLAYKKDDKEKFKKEKEKLTEEMKKEDNGWEMLCQSSEWQDTNQYDYKAVSFINHKTKQICIATAGTKIKSFWDLLDDLLVYRWIVPYKLIPAKAMLDHINEFMNDKSLDIGSYTFYTTGHSLGAVISDLIGREILGRGWELGKCVNFESPGTFPIMEKWVNSDLFCKKKEVSLSELEKFCVTYNVQDNWINTLNSPLGVVKKLIVEQIDDGIKNVVDSVENWSQKLTNYFCNKAKAVVSLLPMGKEIIKGINNLYSHTLKSFEELDKVLTLYQNQDDCEKYLWTKMKNGTTILEVGKETTKKIQDLKSSGNELLFVCAQPDNEDPSYTNVETVPCAYSECIKVLGDAFILG